MIYWTLKEQSKYADQKLMFYPNVIMLSQVYSMLCQQFVEDGMIDGMTSQLDMEESILGTGQSAIAVDSVSHPSASPASLQDASPDAVKDTMSFETVMKTVGHHYGRRGARVEE